jgi:very-short-patch-repair endonuclease
LSRCCANARLTFRRGIDDHRLLAVFGCFVVPSPPCGGGHGNSDTLPPVVGEGEGGGMSTIYARTLRKNPTEAERTLWKHLRMRQLEGHKFRRQQLLGAYIVDLVCLERKVIIEVDGGQHGEQVVSDAERTAWLEARGFRVLRFWNHQVLADVQAVKEAIREALLRT